MSPRAVAIVILAGAVILGGMAGYLFAVRALLEGVGVIACALALVVLSAWVATEKGPRGDAHAKAKLAAAAKQRNRAAAALAAIEAEGPTL